MLIGSNRAGRAPHVYRSRNRHAAIPTGWQLYRDPGGYFTIAVPAGWRIDTSAGTGNINAAQVKTYQTGFLSPGAGDSPAGVFTGLRVSVSYDIYVTAPYSGEYLKQTVCGIAKQANTTLAGLPAEYMRMQGNESSWIVGTSAAPYTISSVLPDTPDGTLRDGSPTPLPESTVQAAQGEANAIVASFRPIPATAPQC